MTLATLKAILPAPENPKSNAGDWEQIEENLNVNLPSEYKEFIEHYGAAYISKFLSIISPFHQKPGVDLIGKQDICRETYRILGESGEYIPYNFFPNEGGLLIVAQTDNGDMVFWNTGAAKWGIVVNESRGPDYFSFDGGIVEFITGLLTGEIDCYIFPMDAFKDRTCSAY
jgi:hypothetical protein